MCSLEQSFSCRCILVCCQGSFFQSICVECCCGHLVVHRLDELGALRDLDFLQHQGENRLSQLRSAVEFRLQIRMRVSERLCLLLSGLTSYDRVECILLCLRQFGDGFS